MDPNTEKKVTDYILCVANDAYKSEQRAGEFSAQFAMLDKTILLRFKTGFARIDRRIAYRLIKNFKKNTGLDLTLDDRLSRTVNNITTGGRGAFYLGDDQVDANHTIAFCQLLNKPAAIHCYCKTDATGKYLNPDFDNNADVSVLWQKFESIQVDDPFYGQSGWQNYCDAYQKIYGHMPPAQSKIQVSQTIKREYNFE